MTVNTTNHTAKHEITFTETLHWLGKNKLLIDAQVKLLSNPPPLISQWNVEDLNVEYVFM